MVSAILSKGNLRNVNYHLWMCIKSKIYVGFKTLVKALKWGLHWINKIVQGNSTAEKNFHILYFLSGLLFFILDTRTWQEEYKNNKSNFSTTTASVIELWAVVSMSQKTVFNYSFYFEAFQFELAMLISDISRKQWMAKICVNA